MEKLKAERVLEQMVQPAARGGYKLKLLDPRVVRQQAQLDALTVEHERLRDLDATRSAQWRTASMTLGAIEAYLRDGRPGGTVLKDVDASEPSLKAGESLPSAIERHRERCEALRANLRAIENAPLPSGHLKEKAKAQIETIASRGAISVSRDGEVAFPTTTARSQVLNVDAPAAIGFTEIIDATALIVFLQKPAVIAAAHAAIDATANDGVALSIADREKRASAVQLELLRTERDLSALIWHGLREGLNVEFGDVSPIAILSCEIITAPARASDGTSVEHGWDIIEPTRP